MKTLWWLIAIVASGALGFYFGIGHGAHTMGAVVAQNHVVEALADIRASVYALEKNDLVYSKRQSEAHLKSALLKIATYSQSLAHWECTEQHRAAIRMAQAYAETNPGFFDGQMQALQKQGLAFCNAKK